MHAIKRQGDGKYYVSAVFGYYEDITATDEYEKYLQGMRNPYWIVWNVVSVQGTISRKRLGKSHFAAHKDNESARQSFAKSSDSLP